VTGNHPEPNGLHVFGAAKAARILGVEMVTVRKYCQQFGVGIKIGQTWLLTEEDIETIKAKRRPAGRPSETGG
jgi:predicted site-specific integrase-resolvase